MQKGLVDEPAPGAEWLTLAEASRYLRVSKPTLYRYCSMGRLRYYKLAGIGTRRFRRSDLDALLLPFEDGGTTRKAGFALSSLSRAIEVGEQVFQGRAFGDDSADLINEARGERSREL